VVASGSSSYGLKKEGAPLYALEPLEARLRVSYIYSLSVLVEETSEISTLGTVDSSTARELTLLWLGEVGTMNVMSLQPDTERESSCSKLW
jgi:hypothetical protein